MKKRTWKTNLFIAGMLTPALLMSLGIVLIPILNSVYRSFRSDDDTRFTLEHYKFLLTDSQSLDHIWYTFWITIVTVVLAILISYLLALYLRFTNTRISKFISTIYLLPRFVPSLVAIYAMMSVVSDTGFLNRIILLIFGANFKPGLLYNASGIIMMNLWFNIAFATMIITAALTNIPYSIIESARDVGASKINVFFTMILPLSFKDVMIAMTFIFMSNISSFTTPYIIGPNHPLMLGVYLRKVFARMYYNQAAALSVIIFLFSCISAVVYLYTNLKEKEWEKTGL